VQFLYQDVEDIRLGLVCS